MVSKRWTIITDLQSCRFFRLHHQIFLYARIKITNSVWQSRAIKVCSMGIYTVEHAEKSNDILKNSYYEGIKAEMNRKIIHMNMALMIVHVIINMYNH